MLDLNKIRRLVLYDRLATTRQKHRVMPRENVDAQVRSFYTNQLTHFSYFITEAYR
jgi:hypothetical protein